MTRRPASASPWPATGCSPRSKSRPARERRDALAHRGGAGVVSRRYRRPDKARTRRLLVRYHKHGDENARERVIQEQLPLAEFLARKFAGRGEPLDDLVQVASVGLIKGRRPLRRGPEDRVLDLRDAEHPGGDQALLPRQGLGDARPARPAGAAPVGEGGDQGRDREDGPVALPAGARRRPSTPTWRASPRR